MNRIYPPAQASIHLVLCFHKVAGIRRRRYKKEWSKSQQRQRHHRTVCTGWVVLPRLTELMLCHFKLQLSIIVLLQTHLPSVHIYKCHMIGWTQTVDGPMLDGTTLKGTEDHRARVTSCCWANNYEWDHTHNEYCAGACQGQTTTIELPFRPADLADTWGRVSHFRPSMQEQNKNRGPERGDCLSLMSDSNVTLLQSTDMLKRIVRITTRS